jgi:hypothetical protein
MATLMLAWPDEQERHKALTELVGIEHRIYVEVQGLCIHAAADEDLPRTTAEKTSAVHFLRFAFAPQSIKALMQAEKVFIGCDHPQYPARQSITPTTLAELRRDFPVSNFW